MRAPLRWFVVAVLSLDAAVALSFLVAEAFGGGAGDVRAAATSGTSASPAIDRPPKSIVTPEAPTLAATAREDGPTAAAAPSTSAEHPPVQDPDDAPATEAADDGGWDDASTVPASDPLDAGHASAMDGSTSKVDAFVRLQRAYEGMEPESAAKALNELAARDREAVVALVLGLKPRTSGAILDAITQINPALAADLSYAIWKESGNAGTAAASKRPTRQGPAARK